MIKTRTWILLFVLLALAGLAGTLYLTHSHAAGAVVEILQDGEVIREVDLSRVTRQEVFTVEWEDGGVNVIEIQPGRIRVQDADCPDRICVDQGWLTDQPAPIVCLPHRLMIRVKETAGDPGVDAVAG